MDDAACGDEVQLFLSSTISLLLLFSRPATLVDVAGLLISLLWLWLLSTVAQNFLNFLCRYFESFEVEDVVTVEVVARGKLEEFDDVTDNGNDWSFVAFKKFTFSPFVRLIKLLLWKWFFCMSSSVPPPGSSAKQKKKQFNFFSQYFYGLIKFKWIHLRFQVKQRSRLNSLESNEEKNRRAIFAFFLELLFWIFHEAKKKCWWRDFFRCRDIAWFAACSNC